MARMPTSEELARAGRAEEETASHDRMAEHWAEQKRQERERARHHVLSVIANAEERICILIDEDEQDEAKEEVVALIAAMRRWLEADDGTR